VDTVTLIKNEGMKILSKHLGVADAGRFIMLIQREPFDCAKWQENLFEDMTVEKLAKKADEYVKARATSHNIPAVCAIPPKLSGRL
jgi:hypothetical protein